MGIAVKKSLLHCKSCCPQSPRFFLQHGNPLLGLPSCFVKERGASNAWQTILVPEMFAVFGIKCVPQTFVVSTGILFSADYVQRNGSALQLIIHHHKTGKHKRAVKVPLPTKLGKLLCLWLDKYRPFVLSGKPLEHNFVFIQRNTQPFKSGSYSKYFTKSLQEVAGCYHTTT